MQPTMQWVGARRAPKPSRGSGSAPHSARGAHRPLHIPTTPPVDVP